MSVTAPAGFVAAGVAAGVKANGARDVALVATDDAQPVTAAALFTSNQCCAAPVEISRRHVANGRACAIIANSGGANAATGQAGLRDARRMCDLTASGLGVRSEDVLVCSTGLIGFPLPMPEIESGIREVVAQRTFHREAGTHAAEAICTTDTVPKESVREVAIGGGSVTIGGMAKGAGMIAPAMATMFAFLTTDARIEAPGLRAALELAVDQSFNRLVVDGCQSTNDTVIALASARSDARPIPVGGPDFHAFARTLTDVCQDLADRMAHDAEGATRVATLTVRGARDDHDARRAARQVANSQLVQCSLDGVGAYWGRIYSELGVSGAVVSPDRIEIAYQGTVVCRGGVGVAHDDAALNERMRVRDVSIDVDLGLGPGRATVVFTALSHAYVDENRGLS